MLRVISAGLISFAWIAVLTACSNTEDYRVPQVLNTSETKRQPWIKDTVGFWIPDGYHYDVLNPYSYSPGAKKEDGDLDTLSLYTIASPASHASDETKKL